MCLPRTRFVQGSNPSWGRKGKGWDQGGRGWELSQSLQGAASRPQWAGLRLEGGPRPPWSLSPWDFLGGLTQADGTGALAGEGKMP